MPRILTGCRKPWFWLLAIALACAVLASRTGTDTDWDLRNYHAYNAHALLTGRFWTDIAPAQQQTFLSPVLDIPLGAIRYRLNGAPVVLNIVLAIPHALAIWLAFVLTLRVVPADLPGRTLISLAATLFGATGAAGLPLLASAQDDMISGSCVLGGLLFLTSGSGRPAASAGCAGLLFGVAAGLKLTALPFCAAGAVALLLIPQDAAAGRLRPVAAYVGAGLLAALLLVGPWCALLFERYHNPILPYMNQWFRSPFVDPLPFTDERFKPRDLAQAMAYPVFWAIRPATLVSELPVRDARFAIAWLASLACLACHVLRRRHSAPCVNRAGLLLSVFFVAALVLWELVFSVFRYLATLELLTGTMVLVALRPLLERPRFRVPLGLGCTAAGIAVAAIAVYPDWGRMDSPRPVRITLPPIEPGSLVILLDPSPMAYLADLVPPAIRFIGVNNNLIQPGQDGPLARQADTMIRSHSGPLYGLEEPSESPGIADRTLAYYGLARDGCAQVVSNLDDNAIRLCRLTAAHRHPPS
jgi:hypothetical protein